jgi:hypothetical protein
MMNIETTNTPAIIPAIIGVFDDSCEYEAVVLEEPVAVGKTVKDVSVWLSEDGANSIVDVWGRFKEEALEVGVLPVLDVVFSEIPSVGDWGVAETVTVVLVVTKAAVVVVEVVVKLPLSELEASTITVKVVGFVSLPESGQPSSRLQGST